MQTSDSEVALIVPGPAAERSCLEARMDSAAGEEEKGTANTQIPNPNPARPAPNLHRRTECERSGCWILVLGIFIQPPRIEKPGSCDCMNRPQKAHCCG